MDENDETASLTHGQIWNLRGCPNLETSVLRAGRPSYLPGGEGEKDYHHLSTGATTSHPRISGTLRQFSIKKMQIPLFHVDAFTGKSFSGNPAAVCILNAWLDDETLRKVAAENNLSATAFLVRKDTDYELRWFTPRCEVRLCGHATLASAHVLFSVLQPGLETVRFLLRFAGDVTVKKDGEFLSMDFPSLYPKPCAKVPPGLNLALGLRTPPLEVMEVNDILIGVFDSADEIRNIAPDFALLEQLHPYAVAVTSPGEDVDFVSRYFAPSYGVPEDHVTGSAHCALTPYWAKRLKKSLLHARQLSERGGELLCETVGERVVLKGKAVLTLTGTLTI